MSRGAVLFDRDGTLTRDAGYTFRIGDLAFLPGAAAAVRAVNAAGFAAIVVTNQSGVARGYFSEAEMWAFNTAMAQALEAEGARLDAIYACPFLPDAASAPMPILPHSIETQSRHAAARDRGLRVGPRWRVDGGR